jgi:hypothetical protein
MNHLPTDFLEHVPEKWAPVFRKGHATTQESRAHPDSIQTGCALGRDAIELEAIRTAIRNKL